MATVQVRYIVRDVDAAIAFYCQRLGFREIMHPAPPFAMLERGELRLVLSAPNPSGGGGQPMPDGTEQAPGGWNRFAVEVEDLEAKVAELREHGARFRNEIVVGVGGKQILVEDPSGNPIELFQPTRAEAKIGGFALRSIGVVRSTIASREAAPKQGSEGAPDAWLEIDASFAPALRGIGAGDEIVVLTWFHRSNRETLEVHPRGDARAKLAGVFATRSPDRPNPIGIHRVTVRELSGNRLRVGPLEAIDGTPVVDLKPVLVT